MSAELDIEYSKAVPALSTLETNAGSAAFVSKVIKHPSVLLHCISLQQTLWGKDNMKTAVQ
jgi:hypothetical protein